MAFSLVFHQCSQNFQEGCRTVIEQWENETAFLQVKTSGSTGTPKTIELSKKQVTASALRTNETFGLKEDAQVVLSLSPATIGGKMILIRAYLGSYMVHVVEPSRDPFENLPISRVYDFISLVPFQLEYLVNHQLNELKRFKQILLGGSPINTFFEQRLLSLQEDIQSNIVIGFGMTETVSHIALRSLGNPVYECLNGVSITSIESNLIIKDELLSINQLKTSDAVIVHNEKQFEWIGRTDFVINSAGVKIHPELLEKAIGEYFNAAFIVVGLPDELLGERCVILCEQAPEAIDFLAIQSKITALFGKYAVPKSIIQHSLSYSGTKIQRLETVKTLLEQA